MISRSQNAACLIVGNEAKTNPTWVDFSAYCLLREQGLRDKAFEHLRAFTVQTQTWEFESKKEFVLWLCGKMDSVNDADYGPYPALLRNSLFAPFFNEWLTREPENDDAYSLKARYLNEHEAYHTAIGINSRNQRARYAIALGCIDAIWHATHHLPEYFIGDEEQVKQIAKEACDHIAHIEETTRRDFLTKELANAEQLLDDWIAFKKEGSHDFDTWCRHKGRTYSWVKAYYYDAKK